MQWRNLGVPEGRTQAALPVVHSVIFTPAARGELIEAQDWYEGEAGLGRRFRQAADVVINRMSERPRQFPLRLQKCPPRSVAALPVRHPEALLMSNF